MSPQRWLAWKLRLLDLAELADAWRLMPRAVLTTYGALCWHLSSWYMALKDPSAQQMAFVTVVVGLAVPLTNFYMQTGRTWK